MMCFWDDSSFSIQWLLYWIWRWKSRLCNANFLFSADMDTDHDLAEKLGFEKIAEQTINECKSTAVLYKHKKTGAEVMSVSNDDENKVFGVVFRTPPYVILSLSLCRFVHPFLLLVLLLEQYFDVSSFTTTGKIQLVYLIYLSIVYCVGQGNTL